MSLPLSEIEPKGFSVEYPGWYIESRREIITRTRERRSVYRSILNRHLEQEYGHGLTGIDHLNDLKEVAFLLSGSRGGSSIAVDILKQQARSFSGSGKKILCFPGEQKPYFELAQLTPPFKNGLSDRLDTQYTQERSKIGVLFTEMLSEVGYPESETNDLIGFAITIYGRLLLQWPNIDFGHPDEAMPKILEAIKTAIPNLPNPFLYIDSDTSREKLLRGLKVQFSDIDLRFYDHPNRQVDLNRNSVLLNYDCFIEEPPFIIPSPWHFISKQELSKGILFMKDPSDAWRLAFWKNLFTNQNVTWVHLTRNAQESVNGLCDGWRFPYGYVTTRSPKLLNVRGYTDHLLPWTEWYANFSTPDVVWALLLGKKAVDLEKIAAVQWADAHKTIIQEVGNKPNYYRLTSPQDPTKFGFEWFRSEPQEAVVAICDKLGIEMTTSLATAIDEMKDKKVQATPGTDANAGRWRTANNYDQIVSYTTEPYVKELSEELGYNTTL